MGLAHLCSSAPRGSHRGSLSAGKHLHSESFRFSPHPAHRPRQSTRHSGKEGTARATSSRRYGPRSISLTPVSRRCVSPSSSSNRSDGTKRSVTSTSICRSIRSRHRRHSCRTEPTTPPRTTNSPEPAHVAFRTTWRGSSANGNPSKRSSSAPNRPSIRSVRRRSRSPRSTLSIVEKISQAPGGVNAAGVLLLQLFTARAFRA